MFSIWAITCELLIIAGLIFVWYNYIRRVPEVESDEIEDEVSEEEEDEDDDFDDHGGLESDEFDKEEVRRLRGSGGVWASSSGR